MITSQWSIQFVAGITILIFDMKQGPTAHWSSLRRFVNKHLLKNNKVILHVDFNSSLCKWRFLYGARFGVVHDISSTRPDHLTVRQNEISFFPSVTR